MVHVNNGWLRSARSIATLETSTSNDVKALHSKDEAQHKALTDVDFSKRSEPYLLRCNSNTNINPEGVGQCWTLLNIGGKGHGGRKNCGIGNLVNDHGVYISASQWGNAGRKYQVRCDHAANAVDDIWKACGSRGGESMRSMLSF